MCDCNVRRVRIKVQIKHFNIYIADADTWTKHGRVIQGANRKSETIQRQNINPNEARGADRRNKGFLLICMKCLHGHSIAELFICIVCMERLWP